MLTTIIHTKSNIQGILFDQPNGIEREYILDSLRTNRLSSIVSFAHVLSQSGKKVYIEVKFQSKYTNRYKRLEVVAVMENICEVYKFTSFSHFDKDALETVRITEELAEMWPNFGHFVPFLVLDETDKLDFVKDSINSMGLNVNVLIN